MFKSKSQLTCSYCSRIFKDPILLPCHDSICHEHLKEEAVLKANRIKCNKCNEEFVVKNNEFKPNEVYTKVLEKQSHLSGDEISLKRKLRESIRLFYEFYDALAQNRLQLESDVYNHFQELRFQIDEQREELKNRIDEIALEMIGKIKKHEEKYLKELKEKLLETQSFEESISFETKLNELEDTFRNPNLLIQSIQEMQQKQEESLNVIQSKLNEMTIVKDNLIATNSFKPNSTSFNQNETTLFGSIKLDGFWFNSINSQILKGEQKLVELMKLCEFSPNDKFTLLYRGTRDGFDGRDFHSKCDGHTNTLTIIKPKESSYIFGGFTTAKWESGRLPGIYKSDPNAFIFSLTNKDNKPVKMKINPKRHKYAIYCFPNDGPTFGGGHDIYISNDANTAMDSYSYLGFSYSHPQYARGTNEARTFLAGSLEFQMREIEVYKKE